MVAGGVAPARTEGGGGAGATPAELVVVVAA